MKHFILFLTLLSLQLIWAQDYPKQLPDFEISRLEGDVFTQEDLQKDTYTFFIYFSPTCGHCQDAFRFLNLKASKVSKANVQLYPISSNTQEETLNFFDTYAPKIKALENVEVLKDDNFKFADLFDVIAFPTSYLYDAQLKLVDVYEGPSEILFFLNDLESK